MLFQFTSFRVREFTDIAQFEAAAGRWLTFREAENSYLLVEIANLLSTRKSVRAFILEEREAIIGAGVLFDSGCLLMTWLPPDAVSALVDHLARSRWPISSVYAPAHSSWTFAEAWAARTNQSWEFDRSERIYQLARHTYPIPADGRLELATAADAHYLRGWTDAFIAEARFEKGDRTAAQLFDSLIATESLYVWKTTVPVSMAAGVARTPRGISISFVYTPPEFRRRGYAKAVVAALGAKLLASDRKYCFIFADTGDEQKHRLYQQVGARTLCEFMRCRLRSAAGVQTSPNGRLNFSAISA